MIKWLSILDQRMGLSQARNLLEKQEQQLVIPWPDEWQLLVGTIHDNADIIKWLDQNKCQQSKTGTVC